MPLANPPNANDAQVLQKISSVMKTEQPEAF
mgnify:CR=1 FL=1